jgi:hypothetical protein
MMQKPHLSVVPRETITSIVEWLSARTTLLGTPTRRLPLQTSVVGFPPEARVVEELVHVPGSPPLFGVLTTPPNPESQKGPVLLLTNAGSAHNVGPNRLYVEMSRRLAAAGFASMRLDLRNLGDSVRGPVDDENHPYPSTAVTDIARAIEWLTGERGFERVVLGGLCSGAYHAFRCGVELTHDAIVGLLLINPLTFRWEQGATISDEATPHARLSDAKKWRKLLRGRYEIWRLMRFGASAVRARVVAKTMAALDRLGMVRPRPLDHEILRCVSAGRRIDFVYSTHDPGYGLLRASTGATVARLARSGALSISLVPGADHSFSRQAWREELIGLAEQHMGRYLVSATVPACAEERTEPARWRRAVPLAARTALEWVGFTTAAPL